MRDSLVIKEVGLHHQGGGWGSRHQAIKTGAANLEILLDKPSPVVDKKPNNEEHIRGEKCRKAATFSQCHAQNATYVTTTLAY